MDRKASTAGGFRQIDGTIFDSRVQTKFLQGAASAAVVWNRLTTKQRSTRPIEYYPIVDDIPVEKPFEGEIRPDVLKQRRVSVENTTYEASMRYTRSDVVYDQTGVLETRARGLGQAVAEGVDRLYLQTLESGLTTNSWDGQVFFDNDHAFGGETWDNLSTGGPNSGNLEEGY